MFADIVSADLVSNASLSHYRIVLCSKLTTVCGTSPSSTSKRERRYVTWVSACCILSYIAIQISLPLWCYPTYNYWSASPRNGTCFPFLFIRSSLTLCSTVYDVPQPRLLDPYSQHNDNVGHSDHTSANDPHTTQVSLSYSNPYWHFSSCLWHTSLLLRPQLAHFANISPMARRRISPDDTLRQSPFHRLSLYIDNLHKQTTSEQHALPVAMATLIQRHATATCSTPTSR
jgi:hypothetical protein